MVKTSQKFYENTYRRGFFPKTPRGLLGKIFLIFKSFEYYREDAVYDLLANGNKMLDLGCGDGHLVIRALAKFQNTVGVDIARIRLTTAKKHLDKLAVDKRKKVRLIIADADSKLPFEKSYFDAVTMVATFEHFFDPYAVMREVSRVLKPGGSVVIQVPNLGFVLRRLAVLFGKLPMTSEDEEGWDGGHLHYFTVDSLRILLEGMGYRIDTVTCSGIFPRLRSWWVSMLGADIVIKGIKD